MFHDLFVSLYSALVVPWLADQAPALVAAVAPLAARCIIAFIAERVAKFVGTVLLALPFFRGRVQPGWVGYVLLAWVLLAMVRDFLIVPNGPAAILHQELSQLEQQNAGSAYDEPWPDVEFVGRHAPDTLKVTCNRPAG